MHDKLLEYILIYRVTVQPRTLHYAAKSVKQRSGRDASSHHEVVLHGLMLVTGSRRLNCYYIDCIYSIYTRQNIEGCAILSIKSETGKKSD